MFFTNANKRKIIELLQKKDMKIADLCKEMGVSRTSIHHHVESLKEEGVVTDYYTDEHGQPHYVKLKEKKQ